MSKILPCIFFGSSNFSVYVLKEFIKKYKPYLVITLAGKPAGRKLKIQPNTVYLFCLKEKLNVIEINKGSWVEIKRTIELLKPTTGIIASFGKIIPKEIIDSFHQGILNIHPSLLPRHRGPNPIRETIIQGDDTSGITIFLIDELVDHGPIISQSKITLTQKETYSELEEKLGKLGGQMLSEIIEKWIKNNKNFQLLTQNENLATYTRKLKKDDGLLSLEEDYQNWDRKIRAYNPWPGTFIYLNNGKENIMLKIFSIEKLKEGDLPPSIRQTKIGNFFTFTNNIGLRLKDGFIILKEVQLENRKKMSGKEFLNGFRWLIFPSKS
ncbi:MAG: methionyl-tRNA formyltransferase [Patescibacteria group bacterium]|nr:methionyl-tRNA formyltransferase [Patescibacteria group bacterium]